MIRKMSCAAVVFLMTGALGILAGCGMPEKLIEQRMQEKEECSLEIGETVQVTYDGNAYVILKETASDEEVGKWVGYIQKLVGVDEAGEVLFQEEFPPRLEETEKTEAALVVTFLNVYQTKENDKDILLVDVNGNYQKAVPGEEVEEGRETLRLADMMEAYEAAGDFKVNPQNATQLLCGDEVIYQVTDEEVTAEQLGLYLDCVAQSVTFDSDTKEILTSEERSKIDWTGGEEAKEGRTTWLYTDVYEIQGADKSSMVAVKINGDYRVARKQ